jgi:hypothetical protein
MLFSLKYIVHDLLLFCLLLLILGRPTVYIVSDLFFVMLNLFQHLFLVDPETSEVMTVL